MRYLTVKELPQKWIDGNLKNLFLVIDERKLVLPKWNYKKYNGKFENNWDENNKRILTMFQLLDDKNIQDYDIMVVPYDNEL